MLPKSFQLELWAYLIEKTPEYADSKNGLDELILLSNAFVDWRYAFEEKPVPAIDLRFLSAFANAAIRTMLSHYNTDLHPVAKEELNEEIEQKSQEIIRLQTKIEKIEVEESKLRERLDKAAGKKASVKVKEAPAKVAATKAKETKKPVATKVKAEPTAEKKPAKAKTRKAATSKAEPTKE